MTSSNKKPKSHLFITTLKFILTLCLAVYLGEDSSVRYNPFTSTLTVNELELFDQEKSQTLLVEYAEISIHLHRLLFKQLYVSEFLLEGTEIKIIKDQQSIIVAQGSHKNTQGRFTHESSVCSGPVRTAFKRLLRVS